MKNECDAGAGDDTANAGAGSDNITGGDSNDSLSGEAGNDRISGNAGNDTPNGGLDVDTMMGGTGNGTYVIDKVGDLVIENAAEGTDLVQSGITYTLTDNTENLTLTGTWHGQHRRHRQCAGQHPGSRQAAFDKSALAGRRCCLCKRRMEVGGVTDKKSDLIPLIRLKREI